MGASRLPGKVMLPLEGAPLLERMIERVRRSGYVDAVVVATTQHPADQVIADLCARIDCACHSGPERDVTERLIGAAASCGGELIVQLTGDCPLVDPAHIDRTIETFYASACDYAANNLTPTLPLGLDVRAFRTATLREVARLTDDPVDRVHGSYFIARNPERYRLTGWQAEDDMRWPELRLTVDEPADYELVRRIFEVLYPENPAFTARDVVALMRARPDLARLNAAVRQKTAAEG